MASAVLMSTNSTPSTNSTLREDKALSIYDSLPILDLWYSNEHDDLEKQLKQKHEEILRRHLQPQNKRRKTACINSVSFSAEPPVVHHYENEASKDSSKAYTKSTMTPSTLKRPQHPHKRSHSSQDFKEFIKHCTSKLTRQLSSSGSHHSSAASAKKAQHRRSA